MHGNMNHLTRLLRGLLALFRQRGNSRSRRIYDRKAEWIRQVHEAPTLAETMQLPARDDVAHRRARRRQRMDGPDDGWSGTAYAS